MKAKIKKIIKKHNFKKYPYFYKWSEHYNNGKEYSIGLLIRENGKHMVDYFIRDTKTNEFLNDRTWFFENTQLDEMENIIDGIITFIRAKVSEEKAQCIFQIKNIGGDN